MALNLEQKKVIVSEVNEVATGALSLVAADYRGLTVSEMTKLRQKARESGVYLRIVRNTLAKRALTDTDFACVNEQLTGPLVLAFALNEPGASARLVRDFAKDHENLEVKAVVLGDQLLTAKDLDAVASLPSKEEAIAILMSVLNAPITKFVRTLAEPHAQVVRAMAAIRDKKEAA